MGQRKVITVELTGEEVDAVIHALAFIEPDLEDRVLAKDEPRAAQREIEAGNRVTNKIREALNNRKES